MNSLDIFSVQDLVQACQGFIRQWVSYPTAKHAGVFTFALNPLQTKTMRTSIISNLRPLLRALYLLLIAIAALSAMPRNARAQLYVTAQQPGQLEGVSTYNTETGEIINLNFITGLDVPAGLVVVGDTLFVSNADAGTVGKYDDTTGGAINPGFITGLGAYFGNEFSPQAAGLAVKDNTLFVAEGIGGPVGKYDATTGKPINANFITGLRDPVELVVLGNILFVADGLSETVSTYDATTGKVIKADFITGLNGPGQLVVLGNALFVPNQFSATVGKYDATTGKTINASFIKGLNEPVGLAVSGNTLFVGNVGNGSPDIGTIGKYDATTGARIHRNFIFGVNFPYGLAVKPAELFGH
jgi:hypothetical protein